MPLRLYRILSMLSVHKSEQRVAPTTVGGGADVPTEYRVNPDRITSVSGDFTKNGLGRRFTRAVSLTLFAVFLASAIASMFFGMVWRRHGYGLAVAPGAVWLGHGVDSRPHFEVGLYERSTVTPNDKMLWWFRGEFGGGLWTLGVPLWTLSLGFGVVAGLSWWRRRTIKDRCQHCGYDLTGATSAVCPECGRRYHAADTVATWKKAMGCKEHE